MARPYTANRVDIVMDLWMRVDIVFPESMCNNNNNNNKYISPR